MWTFGKGLRERVLQDDGLDLKQGMKMCLAVEMSKEQSAVIHKGIHVNIFTTPRGPVCSKTLRGVYGIVSKEKRIWMTHSRKKTPRSKQCYALCAFKKSQSSILAKMRKRRLV